ncbi:MFS transporter [Streptomyces nodosus]|uniref:MFS transporter n=1 Tax=Streptomyces nodosus TaxID=40318 RepID=UPI0036E9D72E
MPDNALPQDLAASAAGPPFSPATLVAPEPRYSPKRWLALAVTLLAVLMDMVDATVINVALPSLREDLHASSTQLEWSVAGYTLAFAAGMIAGGRLGDRYGRRLIFMVGLAAFTVTSALAGLANGPDMLIATRVLQGASAALMVPQVLAMVQVEFPKAEQPKAMSMYGMTFALGGLGGPLLGGVLLDADLFGEGWRPIFYVNVPIGLLGLLGAWLLARESRREDAPGADLTGTLIVTAGLVALLYPLVEGRTLDWPWWTVVLMLLCPVILFLFHRYEQGVVRRGRAPLIDPDLFRFRGAVGGLLVAVVFFGGTAYTLVLTVHLQTGIGYSPLHTALSMIPFTVGVGAGSGFAPQLMVLGRRLVAAGSFVMAVGMTVVLLTIDRYGSGLHSWQLIPGLVISGFGMAMVAGTLVNIVLAKVPREHSGPASSLVNTTIQVGVAAGVALIGTVYFGQLEDGHSPVRSAEVGLWVVVGLYVLSAAVAFVLPAGRVEPIDETAEEATAGVRVDAAGPGGSEVPEPAARPSVRQP